MMEKLRHRWPVKTRREFFASAGSGLAGIALANMLSQDNLLGATRPEDPMAPKKPHHEPKCEEHYLAVHGRWTEPYRSLRPEASSEGTPRAACSTLVPVAGCDYGRRRNNALMASRRTFKQHGQSGLWVSDWYPHVAQHVDRLSVIRSCTADALNHVGSVCQMNTGAILHGHPSMGAWVTYGLGSASRNLPAFVVLADDREVIGGPNNWSSGFLPAVYQGTQFRQGDTPILHLN